MLANKHSTVATSAGVCSVLLERDANSFCLVFSTICDGRPLLLYG